jgi:hypothetical protein
LDSKQEDAHKKLDRVWRRWLSFCTKAGLDDNPFLLDLQPPETELIICDFLALYSVAAWSPAGAILGQRPGPVVLSIVQDAASNLAAAFWGHFQQSPVHIQGSTQLLPTVRALLKAFDNADPPAQRQKAITPKLLWKFFKLLASGTRNSGTTAQTHTADLVLGAFFFAMRSCEYTKTAKLGRTKRIRMGCIIFPTRSR